MKLNVITTIILVTFICSLFALNAILSNTVRLKQINTQIDKLNSKLTTLHLQMNQDNKSIPIDDTHLQSLKKDLEKSW